MPPRPRSPRWYGRGYRYSRRTAPCPRRRKGETMTTAESMLRVAAADLAAVRARWALIGGCGVSVRAAPRFTQDVDFAVAVAGDAEAEAVVLALRSRGYQPGIVLEQTYVDRMSTVRRPAQLSRV